MARASDFRYGRRGRAGKRKMNLSFPSGAIIPALVIAALILFACTQIWQRVYIMNLSGEVSSLKKEKMELRDQLKKKKTEINDFCRHSRIEKLAAEKLGLRQTAAENLFTLVPERDLIEPDRFTDLLASLKKVADHFPVVTESKAETKDIFNFDED